MLPPKANVLQMSNWAALAEIVPRATSSRTVPPVPGISAHSLLFRSRGETSGGASRSGLARHCFLDSGRPSEIEKFETIRATRSISILEHPQSRGSKGCPVRALDGFLHYEFP